MSVDRAPRPPATPLPVDAVVPELRTALCDAGRAVLAAPPGAGKTTRVPLALLPDLDARLIVLEPRRVAARAAVGRLAHQLGEPVGATVGLTTRDERRVGRTTRIEVVTDGVLLRRLQRDPALTGVDLLLFDEFHERNLVADLALAFALEARAALRPDLRLLVASATLATERVAALLGGRPGGCRRGPPAPGRGRAPSATHPSRAAVRRARRRRRRPGPGDGR